MFSKTIQIAVALIAIAIIYQYYKPNKKYHNTTTQSSDNDNTIRRMDEKIALGLNADVDYIVSAVELLKALKATPGRIGANHPTLNTIEELQQIVAYSMATCSGIERHFDNKKMFDEIVQVVTELKHEEFVGGNAALMANKITNLSPSSKVLLAAPVGLKIRKYLEHSIETVSPPNTPEEVHIILEFAKGEIWGEAKATCANRVIISHDIANSKLSSLEKFGETLKVYKPTLVIFSGVHMLDSQPRDFWIERLYDIADVLKTIPRTVPIHLEMATLGNLQLWSRLADKLFPLIDSLGLNEQELVSLAKSKEANFNFTQIGPKPSITDTSDLLHWLYAEYGALERNDSRLTRIHFHSLSFHVIVSPKGELRGVEWKNGLTAVMEGSITASTQACDSEDISSDKFELQIPDKFPLSSQDEMLRNSVIEYSDVNGYVAWMREEIDYFLAPVRVCRKPGKTVGLGDAISATGLLKSEFKFTQQKVKSKTKHKKHSKTNKH